MPTHEITIPVSNTDNETILAHAFITMQHLNWPAIYAGKGNLLGYTPTNWKSKGQQVVCQAADGVLTMSSEMVNNELADVMGKNKKNCNRFSEAFEKLLAENDATRLDDAKTAIAGLRETTLVKVAEEEKEAVEINEAMNLSGSNLYITYGIIGINIIVFILMCLDGAGVMEPNGYIHLKWGSNYAPLTLSGDWWRLITNVFIHFGIIHLAMNMYSLYIVGVYLEPMLGKVKYAAAYICTGVLASIASLWWHTAPANSAGASGAVFGMYGVFFALLTSQLIPQSIRKSLLQSIAIFIGYNLLYGLKGGIDNAAHIGGLLSGFVIGYAYVSAIRKQKAGQQMRWLAPAIVILTIAGTFYYLQQNEQPASGRDKIVNEIKGGSYRDNEKFNDKLSQFDKMHAAIDAAIGDTALTYAQLAEAIDKTALPQFDKAAQLISETNSYSIAPASHQKAALLLQYISFKKEEMNIMKRICLGEADAETLMPELDAAREKARKAYEEAVQL